MNVRIGIGYLTGILLLLPLWGCSSSSQVKAPQVPKPQPASLVLATPLQVSYQSELALARLGQMLSEMELTTEQRAELFYERAVVFDRVGLRSLARLDFNRALRRSRILPRPTTSSVSIWFNSRTTTRPMRRSTPPRSSPRITTTPISTGESRSITAIAPSLPRRI